MVHIHRKIIFIFGFLLFCLFELYCIIVDTKKKKKKITFCIVSGLDVTHSACNKKKINKNYWTEIFNAMDLFFGWVKIYHQFSTFFFSFSVIKWKYFKIVHIFFLVWLYIELGWMEWSISAMIFSIWSSVLNQLNEKIKNI